ncbi:MAG: hypothetical protein OEQ29_19460 [Alphaproteobacteria bacterium]|nr:hypothetical protein [Alphaproteobacteria bacterium]
MEQYRITDRVPAPATGQAVELSEACITALLAMTHYAEHPSDANEYELEIALREIKRLRYVYRWRGEAH